MDQYLKNICLILIKFNVTCLAIVQLLIDVSNTFFNKTTSGVYFLQ